MEEKILENVDLKEDIEITETINNDNPFEDSSIILSKEYMINGQKTKELKMDFDGLTGIDMIKAEKIARLRKDETGNVIFSMTYQLTLAALVAKVPLDDLLALPAKEVKIILSEVYSFLFA